MAEAGVGGVAREESKNMRWWLSVKDMPELADFTENERKNIISDSSLRVFGHWQFWLVLIVCSILGRLGGSLGAHYGGSTASIFGAGLAGGIGGFLLAPFVGRIQIWEIRKAVARRKPKSVER